MFVFCVQTCPTPQRYKYAYPVVWEGTFGDCHWATGDCISPLKGSDCVTLSCGTAAVVCPPACEFQALELSLCNARISLRHHALIWYRLVCSIPLCCSSALPLHRSPWFRSLPFVCAVNVQVWHTYLDKGICILCCCTAVLLWCSHRRRLLSFISLVVWMVRRQTHIT